MKQPLHWYKFHWDCSLFEHGFSNMSAPSSQEWCKRDERPNCDLKICSCSACPRLKRFRKAIAEGVLPEKSNLYTDAVFPKKLISYVDDPPK